MFELVFSAIVFFILCAVLGAISAFVTWLLLRGRPQVRWKMLLAASVPALCGIYMVACLVLFPGVSLFGDIEEPLPNGLSLKAIGKMPDYGVIEATNDDASILTPQTSGWIDKVDLEGDILYGSYRRPDKGSNEAQPPCCFAFNTRTHEVKSFASLDEMNRYAGKHIPLEEVQYFKSQEPAHVRLMRIEKWAFFTPPVIAVLLLAGFLVRWRVTTSPEPV